MQSANPLLIRETLLQSRVCATLMASGRCTVASRPLTNSVGEPIRVDRFKKHDRPLTARDYFNSAQIGRVPRAGLVICFEIVSSKWLVAGTREGIFSLRCRMRNRTSWAWVVPGRSPHRDHRQKDEREEPQDRLNLSTPSNHQRNDPDWRPSLVFYYFDILSFLFLSLHTYSK